MMRRLLLALALLVSSTASAKTSAIVGIALDQSSTVAPSSQTLATPAGETGTITITVTHPDGTAYNLTGAQLLLAVSSKISRQATIDNAAAGTAHFPLVIADTLSMLGTYSYDVTLTASDGSFYRVVPASSFVVTSGIGQPGQAVTVPATQQPLALGPPGGVWFSATFTGVETSISVVFSGIVSNPPKVAIGTVITDGLGFVGVSLSSLSNTGVTVNATAPFTGTVYLIVSN